MNQLRTISVSGLGYVGLPLAVAFAKKTSVIAYDVNEELINNLKAGKSEHYIDDNTPLLIDSIKWTKDAADIAKASFHIVAVPTPVLESRQPDLSIILASTTEIGRQLKKGDIIVYESTVYPGLTEEECIPLLESTSGLISGEDFFVGYSPERINPGDIEHTLENTIKIVAAQDKNTLTIIKSHYNSILNHDAYEVSSIKAAEAAKVIENTQRDINIALMNELAIIFNLAGIDTEEVLKAAGTKWNFLDFTPGLVGGHCIGVDPYYLTFKAIKLGYSPRVILSGRNVNDAMGTYVARMLVKQLIKSGEVVKDATVTILGLAFKENIADIRNSRVVDIIRELESFDLNVQVHDPYVNKNEAYEEYNVQVLEETELSPAQAVILAVPHNVFLHKGWKLVKQLLAPGENVVYDVKSVLSTTEAPENITLLRL